MRVTPMPVSPSLRRWDPPASLQRPSSSSLKIYNRMLLGPMSPGTSRVRLLPLGVVWRCYSPILSPTSLYTVPGGHLQTLCLLSTVLWFPSPYIGTFTFPGLTCCESLCFLWDRRWPRLHASVASDPAVSSRAASAQQVPILASLPCSGRHDPAILETTSIRVRTSPWHSAALVVAEAKPVVPMPRVQGVFKRGCRSRCMLRLLLPRLP